MSSQPEGGSGSGVPGRPGGSPRVSVEELAARRGVVPVARLADKAVEGLFDDEELAAFQEQVRAWRQTETA